MLLPIVLAFAGAFIVTVLLLVAMNISASSRQSQRAAPRREEHKSCLPAKPVEKD